MREATRWALVLAAVATLLTLPAAPPARALPSLPTGETWAAELAVADGDDVDVVAADGAVRLRDTTARTTTSGPAPAEGTLLLPPRRLGAVADRISAAVTADTPPGSQVLVAVRGLRDDGSWSEWIPTGAQGPAQLPAATLQVQVRVTLVAGDGGAGPALRRLWLTADATPTPRRSAAVVASPPFTARVFATRLGLVGDTTANGHRIVTDDRFVALPSRRGLAPDGAGDYTVRVCADNGRCAWAPVWDVGPWNIRDDYWNADRESFSDLPRGVPQAQAARDDGYNGGRDGFGRRVANPAGIDLADGTFRRDLRLADNSPVDVTYLWTGTGPAGTTSDDPLTVRSAPSAEAPDVGSVAPRSRVLVECAAPAGSAPSSSVPLTTTAPPATPTTTAAPPADQAAVARRPAVTTTTAPPTTTPATDRWLRLGPDQYVPATALEVPDVPAC
ncbi:hypothetical protein [Actinomycetospora sp. NBRC 106378]|uniref:hypothetical protein n=1 Tax=Actinomycetospora sp. NBRC 106378 TaxID=3032208 RepID=UPI0024A29358|nr:hypothetical protein [Actinomycetospora sp. NBRC 106378]GLZ55134.1 hypothetical protein Acsp07_47510 [Actinomycetospora sp. NBRC 106378]